MGAAPRPPLLPAGEPVEAGPNHALDEGSSCCCCCWLAPSAAPLRCTAAASPAAGAPAAGRCSRSDRLKPPRSWSSCGQEGSGRSASQPRITSPPRGITRVWEGVGAMGATGAGGGGQRGGLACQPCRFLSPPLPSHTLAPYAGRAGSRALPTSLHHSAGGSACHRLRPSFPAGPCQAAEALAASACRTPQPCKPPHPGACPPCLPTHPAMQVVQRQVREREVAGDGR